MIDLCRARPRITTSLTCLLLLTPPVAAQDLAWPQDAELARASAPALGRLQVALGPFAPQGVPTEWLDGAVSEQIWQIPGADGDPALLAGLIRDQLAGAGFEILFSCADRQCGGFDFRYALPIAEGPDMHVDLGNFHYLAATRPSTDGPTHLAVTLSHGGRQGYAHVATVSPADAAAPVVTQSTRLPEGDLPEASLVVTLLDRGRVVLDDLDFDSGASALSDTEYGSLSALAGFLQDNPTRQIILVGHTDTQGALDANIALSQARARSVREALLAQYDIDPAQVAARGVGYLAPQTTNGTEDGRHANRRVEAVLADIQ
jgi:OOP family OmpA-OmpF porin